MTARIGWFVWTGLALVLVSAAVLSFDALRSLALAASISPWLAWLLPIAVDAGAAVSCSIWLGGNAPPAAARYAGRTTWVLLLTTVAGNAAQLGMHSANLVPPWWVAGVVGTIPPAVVGSTVHLVVLLRRAPGAQVTSLAPATPAEDQTLTRARQLVANGAGRGTLAKELRIPEHQARTLLDQVRAS